MLNLNNVRFAHSAELFFLCKEILNSKHARGEKVAELDVGKLIDFDSVETTHWKNGRRHIKTFESSQKIAAKLEIDEISLLNLAQGRTPRRDILADYQGYGSFECDTKTRSLLLAEALSLIKKAQIITFPVNILKLISVVPEIEVRVQKGQEEFIAEKLDNNVHIISLAKQIKLCGSIRFHLMQRVAKIYLQTHSARLCLHPIPHEAQCNLFALFLLAPTDLMQVGSCLRVPANDMVQQLTHLTWLTRSLINIRLKDFFTYKN